MIESLIEQQRFLQANEGCSETFLASLSYSQVAGLFLGMVVVGFTVDRIGRKAGSITTAFIMLAGSFTDGVLE